MAEENNKLATPDLEKARDEKCIPVARAVLKDCAELMIPDPTAAEKTDASGLILKILGRTLEVDMNITTEVSYTFQLVLAAFTGLNKAVQDIEKVPMDDARYAEIAKKILTILSSHEVRLTDVKPEESVVDYAPIKEELAVLFTAEKLNKIEVKYIMDSIFESFSVVHNGFQDSLEKSSKRAEAKLFGLDDMTDLGMKKLNEVLMAE